MSFTTPMHARAPIMTSVDRARGRPGSRRSLLPFFPVVLQPARAFPSLLFSQPPPPTPKETKAKA